MPGFPVTLSDNGTPFVAVTSGGAAATISPNGKPIKIVANNAPPLVVEGLIPPIEWNWRPFGLTAGDSGDWLGYSNGDIAYPPFNPPVGLISSQPTNVTDLISLFQDSGSGDIVAVFHGDYTESLQYLNMSIGGYELNIEGYSLLAGNTWLRFGRLPGSIKDGQVYEILFHF